MTGLTCIEEQFHEVKVRIFEVDNQAFISGEDLGSCLKLSKPKIAVNKIFRRHKEELEPHTRLVTIDTPGGPQETRLFSEAGAYLITMFARSPKAKEVRQWLAELPKKVRDFGQVTQEEIQRVAEEARKQGRLDALKELAAKPDNEDEDLLDEISRLADIDNKYSALSPGAMRQDDHFKTARAAYELCRLDLIPDVLDRLLLYWILDRSHTETSRALSLEIEKVETVFGLFHALDVPQVPGLLSGAFPWEEPLKGISRKRADLERVEHRLRDLADKVNNFAGGCPKINQAFAILHEVAPPWMIVTPRKVHLTKDLILALNLKTRTMADLARALGWGVSYLKGSGSGFRTITMSRKDFYARYIKGQTPALPAPVEATSAAGPSTRGKAMADWIQRTWEESNSRYKIWLERQFIKAFPEAKGTVGFI